MTKHFYQKTFHYTYLIIELDTKIKYIGVRSSDEKPELDLGFNYFSSSTNKEFIKNQKLNPSNYKYEVLDVFTTRKDANLEEKRLHLLYNVSLSEEYYNKTNASGDGYNDTIGMIVAKDSNGNHLWISNKDPRYISGQLVHINKGKTLSENHKNKIKEGVNLRFSNIPMKKKEYTDKWYDWKNNLSITRLGKNNSFYGKSHTIETKKKISETLTGMNHSDEAKMKISNANKGKTISEEQKKIIGFKNRKKYIINGVKYDGRQTACDALCISPPTLRSRCASNKFPDWIELEK